MPVPSSISDLSQTANSNSPAGSESPNTADDYLRTLSAFIATLRDGKGFTDPVVLASGATTDIGASNAFFVQISGTTTITSFGTNYNGPRFLRFEGALTLTHSSSLSLPGAANITTEAGDTCIAIPNSTPNGWNIVQYQRAAIGPDAININALTTVIFDPAADFVAIADASDSGNAKKALVTVPQIQSISASVGSNALTISATYLSLDFRSTTLGSGTVTKVTGTPANLVISSGSTLGTTNGIQSDIAVLAINNAGAIELAVVNMSGGVDLSETGLISTTAEGGAGAADSASTIYSTTARSNVAYRVIGFIRSTQATAGTWATAPSLIQGSGGNALPGIAKFITSAVIPTTSGTSIEFIGVPAWAKRIDIPFATVSTNGTSLYQFQIGSGSFATSGYISQAWSGTGSGGVLTSGVYLAGGILAANLYTGIISFVNLGGNRWVATGIMNIENASNVGYQFFGVITLAGTLDRVRLTTVSGADTFDSGSLSVSIQGY